MHKPNLNLSTSSLYKHLMVDVLVDIFVTERRYPRIHCSTRRQWVSDQLRSGNWGVPVQYLHPASTSDTMVPVYQWAEGLSSCTGATLTSVLYLNNNHYVNTTRDFQHQPWLSILTTCTLLLKVSYVCCHSWTRQSFSSDFESFLSTFRALLLKVLVLRKDHIVSYRWY